MSAGRITLAEYDERVTNAYAATTFGDLAALTADLPPIGRTQIPAPTSRPWTSGPHTCGPGCGRGYGYSSAPDPASAHGPDAYGRGDAWGRHGRNHSWHSWVRTSLIVLAIWLATSLSAGGPRYFWPIWVIVPWGAVLLARWITGGHDRGRERRLHV